MSGKRIIVIERRTFTFTGLGASGTQTTPFERALDVTGYPEGTVQVIVHAQTMAAPQAITITATPVQLIDSEPQTDFLATTAAATATIPVSSTGKLIPAQLTAGFGSHLQFAINATQSTAGATFSITITVILVVKE